MNVLDKRIKRIMDDIIDVAYKNEDPIMKKKFHQYKLSIIPTENESKSGDYAPATRQIRVYNPSLGTRHMAKCCIHELSHHIDCMLHGTSGHQKPFYEIYKRLAYASLDMGILRKRDFYDSKSSDRNKVIKFIEQYEPHKVAYKMPEDKYIAVKNCFKQKDALKEAGYKWNSVEQTWEKETEDQEADIAFLEKIDCKEYVIKSSDMYVKAVVYIAATGKTFDIKDTLKDEGFFFDKDTKLWKKKTSPEDAEAFIAANENKYKGVTFGILKRK